MRNFINKKATNVKSDRFNRKKVDAVVVKPVIVTPEVVIELISETTEETISEVAETEGVNDIPSEDEVVEKPKKKKKKINTEENNDLE